MGLVCTRTFTMRSLWLLLLLLAAANAQMSVQDNQTNSSPEEGVTSRPAEETQGTSGYKLKAVNDSASDPLDPLYKMARHFAEIVGPKEPVIDHILSLLSGNDTLKLPDDYDKLLKIVKDEAGFMACLACGLILFFGLGVSGAIFCCCRCCCSNCGAEKVQNLRDNLDCGRRTYFCLSSVTLLFMIAAVACGYAATWALTDAVMKSEVTIVNILEDTDTFFKSTSQELNYLGKGGLNDTVNNITSTLYGIEDSFGKPLQKHAEDEIKSIASLAGEIDKGVKDVLDAKRQLEDPDLKTHTRDIEIKLQDVKLELDNIKKQCSEDLCQNINPEVVKAEQVNTGFIKESDLPKDIQGEVNKFEPEVKNIASEVKKNTDKNVKDIKKKLDDVVEGFDGGEFQKIINETSQVTKFVPDTTKDVKKTFVEIKQHELNWYCGLASVVSLVTLPVLLICLGMCCGCTGHRQSRHPADRGCLSNCGGCTIITGVYLLFFITGIPILVSILLFQLGGHVQTHLCTVVYEEDLQSFDKYFNYAKKEFKMNEDIFKDMQPSRTFFECQKGSSIIRALNLTDIEKELDVENKVNVTGLLSGFDFDVSAEVKISTDEVSKKVKELDSLDTEEFIKLKKQVTSGFVNQPQLESWITQLQSAKEAITDNVLKQQIQQPIDKLVEIRNILNSDFGKKWKNIAASLENVDIAVLKENANQIDERSKKITNNIADKANELKKDFVNSIMKLVNSTVDSLQLSCKPIWQIFDNSRHMICRDLLDPLNGYWFSLGWSVFFIIFAIAFATKLAKHYTRMSDMKRPAWEDERLDPRDVKPSESQPCIPMKHSDPYYYQNPGYQTPPPRGPPSYYPPPNPYGPPQHYGTQQYDYDERVKGFSKH